MPILFADRFPTAFSMLPPDILFDSPGTLSARHSCLAELTEAMVAEGADCRIDFGQGREKQPART
jgi:hypothetical protein